jgi:raffinose/stachyose/melibiose transport system substrate-binding protein
MEVKKMVPRTTRRSIVALGAGGLALSLALAGCSAGDSGSDGDGTVELSILVDSTDLAVQQMDVLT